MELKKNFYPVYDCKNAKRDKPFWHFKGNGVLNNSPPLNYRLYSFISSFMHKYARNAIMIPSEKRNINFQFLSI